MPRWPSGKRKRSATGSDPTVEAREIWWVDFGPAQGSEIQKRRPAVILIVDGLNRARRTVVVAPLSRSPTPRPPIVVSVPSAGPQSVVCDQMRAVDKRRLGRHAGRLSEADLRSVEQGIRAILGL